MEWFEKNNLKIALNKLYVKDTEIFPAYISINQENKLKSHEKARKDKDFCSVAMPSGKNKILNFNQYTKSDKMPYIIYADIECLIKKIDGCKNNPNISSAKK